MMCCCRLLQPPRRCIERWVSLVSLLFIFSRHRGPWALSPAVSFCRLVTALDALLRVPQGTLVTRSTAWRLLL